jgi:hypothetical protein
MGQVIASASMSLDGYIAKDDNTIGRLFDWLQNGSVEFRTVNDDITLHLSPPSAEYWKQWMGGLGVSCAGAPCSTSPAAGAARTPWTSRWSW